MHHCVEVSSSRRTTFKTSFESQMKYAETKTTKRQHIKVSKIHLPSIVFEWIPVTGSLKWREWLTVECEYPKNTKIQNISWSKYITTFVNQTIISLPTIRNDVRARTHTAKNNFFKSFLSIIIIYPARALRALGLLLADGTLTVGGGKTFWRVSRIFLRKQL